MKTTFVTSTALPALLAGAAPLALAQSQPAAPAQAQPGQAAQGAYTRADTQGRPAVPASDVEYSQAMERLFQAAQRLRESVQAMAQQPAGERRNQAIAQAREALLSTHQAMVQLPPDLRTSQHYREAERLSATRAGPWRGSRPTPRRRAPPWTRSLESCRACRPTRRQRGAPPPPPRRTPRRPEPPGRQVVARRPRFHCSVWRNSSART